jgi:hypothetical protein
MYVSDVLPRAGMFSNHTNHTRASNCSHLYLHLQRNLRPSGQERRLQAEVASKRRFANGAVGRSPRPALQASLCVGGGRLRRPEEGSDGCSACPNDVLWITDNMGAPTHSQSRALLVALQTNESGSASQPSNKVRLHQQTSMIGTGCSSSQATC